jgi:hypothetical protein
MQPRLFWLPFVHRKGDTVCQVCLKTELRSRWIPPIEGLRFRIRFYPSMGGIKPNPSHWYVGSGLWLASQSRISLWYVAAFHSLIISKVNKGIRFFNFIISSWTSNGCRIDRMKRQRMSPKLQVPSGCYQENQREYIRKSRVSMRGRALEQERAREGADRFLRTDSKLKSWTDQDPIPQFEAEGEAVRSLNLRQRQR